MLSLTATTDAVEIVLAGAQVTSPMQCVATWRDLTASAFTPGRSLANSSGTTPVQLIAPPAASTQRVIDFVSVFNDDTVTQAVTVRFNANGSLYKIIEVSLGANERWEWADGAVSATSNSAGATKTIATGTSNTVGSSWSTVVLGGDIVNAAANVIADVTGLSFPVVNGNRYNFRFVINYTANATTTGSRWALQGPTFSELRYKSEYSLTTTTNTINQGVAAYDSPAGVSASSAATTSNLAVIEGFILPTADGNVIARFASEIAVANGIVAKRGSYVNYIAV